MKITFTNDKLPPQPGLVYQNPVAVPEHMNDAWRAIRDVKPVTPALIPSLLRPEDMMTNVIEGLQSGSMAWQSHEAAKDKQGDAAGSAEFMQAPDADQAGQ